MTDSLHPVRPLMTNNGETNFANKLTNTLGVSGDIKNRQIHKGVTQLVLKLKEMA